MSILLCTTLSREITSGCVGLQEKSWSTEAQRTTSYVVAVGNLVFIQHSQSKPPTALKLHVHGVPSSSDVTSTACRVNATSFEIKLT